MFCQIFREFFKSILTVPSNLLVSLIFGEIVFGSEQNFGHSQHVRQSRSDSNSPRDHIGAKQTIIPKILRRFRCNQNLFQNLNDTLPFYFKSLQYHIPTKKVSKIISEFCRKSFRVQHFLPNNFEFLGSVLASDMRFPK